MESLEEVSKLLSAVKYEIVPYTRGMGVDIGEGRLKAYRHFITVRKRGDKLIPADAPVDHWVEEWGDALKDFADDKLDFVFQWGDTVGVLLSEVERVLKVGGHFVTANDAGEVSLLRKADDGIQPIDRRIRQEKTACVVRYGAIGDALQAGCVLPELKRQGYHVTYMCEPLGESVMRHDPHIDAFIVQDPDQVPNLELKAYFDHWRKKYDKWINLCESVEGTLICLPGRAKFEFPKAVRHELCNQNYLEFMCKLAEQPFTPEHHFYPSDDERKRAEAVIEEIAKDCNKGWVMGERWVKPFVILWALAGSGVHKYYPHQDAVIARILLEIPHARIILTGGNECKVLEVGWENEPRVRCTSGELKLRDALALAQQCNLVIGPETGLLNSVAFESMAKIVFLSHSTEENLTKHWVNTEALHSSVTPCYPCHQLHHDRTACPSDPESGAAMCQQQLDATDVWAAVQRAYTASGTVKKILESA